MSFKSFINATDSGLWGDSGIEGMYSSPVEKWYRNETVGGDGY